MNPDNSSHEGHDEDATPGLTAQPASLLSWALSFQWILLAGTSRSDSPSDSMGEFLTPQSSSANDILAFAA